MQNHCPEFDEISKSMKRTMSVDFIFDSKSRDSEHEVNSNKNKLKNDYHACIYENDPKKEDYCKESGDGEFVITGHDRAPGEHRGIKKVGSNT